MAHSWGKVFWEKGEMETNSARLVWGILEWGSQPEGTVRLKGNQSSASFLGTTLRVSPAHSSGMGLESKASSDHLEMQR